MRLFVRTDRSFFLSKVGKVWQYLIFQKGPFSRELGTRQQLRM